MTKTKNSKFIGIAISILMIICGIIAYAIPGKTLAFYVWFIVGTLIVNGIYKLAVYFTTPKESKNGWLLADGIISTLIGILLFTALLDTPIITTFNLISSIGFLLGFYEVFVGINQLCNLGMAESKGWTIFIGIINIICGFVILTFPVVSIITVEWALALFLVIFGIINLISTIFD